MANETTIMQGKGKIEIHAAFFRDSRIGTILPGAGKNKKFACMI